MELKWTSILLFALLNCISCLDWQGAGNWTHDNLTTIRSKIFAFPTQARFQDYPSLSATFSDQLNTLWDPAWNIFIISYSDGKNYDSVLYGYGFRNHWFWFNGFQIRSGYASFIIWKDYNCLKWNSFSSIFNAHHNMDATLSSTIKTKLQQGRASLTRNVEDIWVFAQDVQASLPSMSPALVQEQTAYTIVAMPTNSIYMFGRFCAKYYNLVYNIGNKPGGYVHGAAMILQMRDQ